MSAPRHVSVNALRMLAAGSRQARYLHMTGSAPSPSRALTSEKNIAALTSKAKKSVSKGERPTVNETEVTQSRTFNTSRAHKAVNDTSTVDFAYMPSAAYSVAEDELRVPIIYGVTRTSPSATAYDVPEAVHRPLITTVMEDASHVSTSHGLAETKHESLGELFEEMPEKMKEMMKEPEKMKGFLRTLFGGLVEDVFGQKKLTKA